MKHAVNLSARPHLSIIVVSYNTRALTLDCLASVYEQTLGHSFEVLLVDNASTDGSAQAVAERFPQVRLLALDRNLGFARANNLAAEQARGEWILLLNPDTVVLDRAIDKLLEFAERNTDAGIFGGRTLFPDGSLNPTSCWQKPTPWSVFCVAAGLAGLGRSSRLFNPEAMPDYRRDTVRQVDIVTGCFFLLKRTLWERLGGFDPAFFMYGEESDLCLRAAREGVVALICPEAEIIHIGGASERVRASKMIRLFTAKAELFRRHWSPTTAGPGAYLLDLWALIRWAGYALAGLVKPDYRTHAATWAEVWQARKSWHQASSSTEQSNDEAGRELSTTAVSAAR